MSRTIGEASFGVGDRVTWIGWGHIASAPINCKGKVLKILSYDENGLPNGWVKIQKSNSVTYVEAKKLKKL